MNGLTRVAIGLGLVLCGTIAQARAQDLDEVEVQPVVVTGFELHESNFEQWIYGNGAARGLSGREHLDSLLMLNLNQVEQSCKLSEAQKKKLLLAGRGDIKHFLDRVAEARKVFEQFRHDQNKMGEIVQETQPLAATLNTGLFGQGSFFAKTVGATLTPEQANHLKESIRESDRFRYRAKVRLAVTTLDNAMGLTAEQRQKLIDLVLAETKPPEKPVGNGQYESYVVLYKISLVPEAKLRSILDNAQWQALNQQLQQSRGMERFLKSNGYLD